MLSFYQYTQHLYAHKGKKAKGEGKETSAYARVSTGGISCFCEDVLLKWKISDKNKPLKPHHVKIGLGEY